MALFYTDKQLDVDSFYGGEHRFNGLAVIFDSSNTDPNVIYIYLMIYYSYVIFQNLLFQ